MPMKNNLEQKLVNYKKSFSYFLNESDFSLLERLENVVADRIINNKDLLQKARLTFKTFRSENSFDKEWLDLIAKIVGYNNIEPQQMNKLCVVVPMEVYNFLKDTEEL